MPSGADGGGYCVHRALARESVSVPTMTAIEHPEHRTDSLGFGAPTGRFAHQAFFYADSDEYVATLAPFVREGVQGDEAVLVAVDTDKRRALQLALGDDAANVDFLDMRLVGGNPGRIIPLWIDFVERNSAAGRPMRGIGEPAWAERSVEALTECHQHEALLNVAFGDGPGWPLVCPYDASAMAAAALAEARRTHPLILEPAGVRASDAFALDLEAVLDGRPLSSAPAESVHIDFNMGDIRGARAMATDAGIGACLDAERLADFVLAVSEAATNSVMHGRGHSSLRVWETDDHVVAEVTDQGTIDDPLAGRRPPPAHQVQGRGLWLVNQVCDLVQLRTSNGRTIVRMHIRKGNRDSGEASSPPGGHTGVS